ncbi:sulfatase family protein [Ulvibacterium sp.]|uniref:sulfatase family protein n=1 Tax=Ulvibacterium sp. TaxID=2665914 RepID=UPI003BAACA1C
MLKNRFVLVGMSFLMGWVLLFSCKKKESVIQPPNIVIILADDLGYGDLGSYNENSLVPTPNLDKLANEGIRLTDAYCPVAVCSPSRFALMTGSYPWRSWHKQGVLGNYEPSMMAKGQLTLPGMLQRAGYMTAGFGKWHLGTSFPTLDGQKPAGYGKFRAEDNGANLDFSKLVYDGPVDHGFEHWLGFSCASECWILDGKEVVGALQHDYYTTEAAPNTGHLESIPMDRYLPFITKKSLEFLEEHNSENGEKPFFLYFSPYVPHTPLAPSKSFKGVTKAGEYGDYVHELDYAIGKILKTLDSLRLTENTIVMFASDNGSAFPIIHNGVEDSDRRNRLGGHHQNTVDYPNRDFADTEGRSVHYPNKPLKGTKQTAWEGGVRTPFIARWPGKFPKGATSDGLFALNDVMPTLARIIQFELPKGASLDGYDQLSVLEGKKEGLRKSIVVQSSNNIFGLRRGEWKYIEPTEEGKEGELYNLKDDISESKNRFSERPELARELKEHLKAILHSKASNIDGNP